MAGIRGVRNPIPQSGSSPQGIFSSKGSQKKDSLSAEQQKYAKYTGSNYRMERKDPVKRDNGLKG